jgi:DNA-binding CsgD family transcriptional regulator
MSGISKTVFPHSVVVPEGANYSLLTELFERHPMISIIVLTGRHEAMLGALQLMLGSCPNVHAEISDRYDASAPQPNKEDAAINRTHLSPSDLGLTERQLDVLALMMQAKSNKAICRVLNLAVPTVKNHVTAILRALKVSNRVEAVIAVREWGWKLPTPAQLDLQSSIPRSPQLRFCRQQSPA